MLRDDCHFFTVAVIEVELIHAAKVQRRTIKLDEYEFSKLKDKEIGHGQVMHGGPFSFRSLTLR